MTEILLRDRIELEKQRDKIAEVNRVAALESGLAVVRTILDAHLKAYAEIGISEDDLKTLRRELEDEMINTVKNANEQQAKDILGEVRGMLNDQRHAQSEDQKQLRRQVAMMVFGSALSVLGALIVFWLTTRGH